MSLHDGQEPAGSCDANNSTETTRWRLFRALAFQWKEEGRGLDTLALAHNFREDQSRAPHAVESRSLIICKWALACCSVAQRSQLPALHCPWPWWVAFDLGFNFLRSSSSSSSVSLSLVDQNHLLHAALVSLFKSAPSESRAGARRKELRRLDSACRREPKGRSLWAEGETKRLEMAGWVASSSWPVASRVHHHATSSHYSLLQSACGTAGATTLVRFKGSTVAVHVQSPFSSSSQRTARNNNIEMRGRRQLALSQLMVNACSALPPPPCPLGFAGARWHSSRANLEKGTSSSPACSRLHAEERSPTDELVRKKNLECKLPCTYIACRRRQSFEASPARVAATCIWQPAGSQSSEHLHSCKLSSREGPREEDAGRAAAKRQP